MSEPAPTNPRTIGRVGAGSHSAEGGSAHGRLAANLVSEIRGHYPRGAIKIAVSGADLDAASGFADQIALAFSARGDSAHRISTSGIAGNSVLDAGTGAQGAESQHADSHAAAADLPRAVGESVTIVSGTGLTSDPVAGRWNYSILIVDPLARIASEPKAANSARLSSAGGSDVPANASSAGVGSENRDNASALVTLTGSAGPRRLFADHC